MGFVVPVRFTVLDLDILWLSTNFTRGSRICACHTVRGFWNLIQCKIIRRDFDVLQIFR